MIDHPRLFDYIIIGVMLAIVVLGVITKLLVEPMAATMQERKQHEIQERYEVAWEDVDEQRCYWRKVESDRRICVPTEAR